LKEKERKRSKKPERFYRFLLSSDVSYGSAATQKGFHSQVRKSLLRRTPLM
jgi:hypothetical protein